MSTYYVGKTTFTGSVSLSYRSSAVNQAIVSKYKLTSLISAARDQVIDMYSDAQKKTRTWSCNLYFDVLFNEPYHWVDFSLLKIFFISLSNQEFQEAKELARNRNLCWTKAHELEFFSSPFNRTKIHLLLYSWKSPNLPRVNMRSHLWTSENIKKHEIAGNSAPGVNYRVLRSVVKGFGDDRSGKNYPPCHFWITS